MDLSEGDTPEVIIGKIIVGRRVVHNIKDTLFGVFYIMYIM